MNKNKIISLVFAIGAFLTPISYYMSNTLLDVIFVEIKSSTNESYFRGGVGMWAVDMVRSFEVFRILNSVEHIIILIIFTTLCRHFYIVNKSEKQNNIWRNKNEN